MFWSEPVGPFLWRDVSMTTSRKLGGRGEGGCEEHGRAADTRNQQGALLILSGDRTQLL